MYKAYQPIGPYQMLQWIESSNFQSHLSDQYLEYKKDKTILSTALKRFIIEYIMLS